MAVASGTVMGIRAVLEVYAAVGCVNCVSCPNAGAAMASQSVALANREICTSSSSSIRSNNGPGRHIVVPKGYDVQRFPRLRPLLQNCGDGVQRREALPQPCPAVAPFGVPEVSAASIRKCREGQIRPIHRLVN